MAEIAQPATPMMRQYLEVKSRYPDAILFFRLGDFYEMFAEDAVQAAEVLQITLTSRAKGDGKIPMCGIPYHAARGYVAKLLERGFKVAICDQVEPPGKGGIVKREVTRVVTPGTVLDEQSLDPRESSFLGAVSLDPDGNGGGLALLDATTGELRCGEVGSDVRLGEEMRKAGVRELVLSRSDASLPRAAELARTTGVPIAETEDAAFQRASEKLSRHLGVAGLDGFGVGHLPRAIAAASGALHYLSETQRTEPRHVDRISLLPTTDVLLLDESTRANLEVERTLSGGRRKGSLLGMLDRSVTGAGGRRLAEWLRYPLTDVAAIDHRLDAVEALAGGAMLRERFVEALRPVADVERLLSRLALRQGNARDLRAMAGTLTALPAAADLLEGAGAGLLAASGRALRGLEDLAALLEKAVADEPPATTGEGGMIRRGWSEELDRLVALSEDGKGVIASLESRERQRTGIGSLKVRYNRVFGYYIEVTKPNLHLVPEDYSRKQTTVGGERFVTPELKDHEERVLGAEEKRRGPRGPSSSRSCGPASSPRLAACALRRRPSPSVDVLLSLARVAPRSGYCAAASRRRRRAPRSRRAAIRWSRRCSPPTSGFVPNDVACLNERSAEPSSSSSPAPTWRASRTVIRQMALIALLAQIGQLRPGGTGARSGWSTGSSRASGRRTTSPAASPPSWWR